MIRNDDNDRLAACGRTSICCSSVQNLGDNSRVDGYNAIGGAQQMPRSRQRTNYYPGHARVLALLVKCVPMCYWKCVRRCSKAAMKRPKMPDDQCILGTPMRWIQDSLREKCYHVTQLCSLEELPETWCAQPSF
jgi:hypothetical protein